MVREELGGFLAVHILANLNGSVEAEWADMSEDLVVKSCQKFRPEIKALQAMAMYHLKK